MNYFVEEYLNMFLGVVRKYMQMRGNLSQKDLSEITDIGVSTISRFLNQKTKELDPQLIANIVAKLEIPIHEIIDFIEEDSTDKFKKLVQFYKDEEQSVETEENKKEDISEPVKETFETSGTAQKTAKARVRIGNRTTTIPFEKDEDHSMSIRDKLNRLTPRQKAYISDFLNLDVEGRDLIVDMGTSLFRYFRHKGVEFDV